MRLRWLSPLAALLLALPVQAGEKAATPAVVVRVRSLDAVLQNARLLVSLTGEEAAARQIEGLLKAKAGAKGIEGIDPTRPAGAYVRFGKEIEDVSGAVLIPVANEKAVLDLLERLNILTTKGKNDIYTVQTGKAFDLYFRFAKGYAYVTGINPDNLLDRNLLDPAAVLGGTDPSVFSTLVRLDQLPEGAKLLAQAQLEQKLMDAQEKGPPGESPAQKEFRVNLLREAARIGASILKEGAELRFDLGLDEKSKDFTANLALSGQSGSELARALQNLGRAQSRFAGLAKKEYAFLGTVNATLPDALAKSFMKVIDEGLDKAMSELRDEQKKKQAQQLYQGLAPTVRSGQVDGFFSLLGPTGNTYTLLAGLHLEEGDKLGKTIHDLVEQAAKDLPAQEKAKIHLDIESVGTVKIHKFELPGAAAGDKLRELVAAKDLYLAFRDDAVFFALGQAALPSLKEAVANRATAEMPLFLFNFDVGRMVPVLAKNATQKELAAKIFQPGQESNLRVVVNGGTALTVRMQMKLNALEFLAKLKDKRGE